jgi:hypothetical protein
VDEHHSTSPIPVVAGAGKDTVYPGNEPDFIFVVNDIN